LFGHKGRRVMMRQIVGSSCVLCRERIGSILDGQFCASCGCPVHTKCVQPAAPIDGATRCAACGTAKEHAPQEQERHRRYEDRRATGGRNPKIFIAGLVGCGIMTVSACNATINPAPDGRLLNTVPALGFDSFLPIGILGMGFCLIRLMMGR
jgi:hypothetical protein